MTLWLVGMMGSGKTTAGSLAAQSANVEFADTDALVESGAGRSVAEIWEAEGEEGFRAREMAVIATLPSHPGIVATGGGAVIEEANRSLIAGSGDVVWLRASPAVIAARLGTATGPLLAGSHDAIGTLASVLEDRWGLYESLAGWVIDTDGLTIPEVADKIGSLWSD